MDEGTIGIIIAAIYVIVAVLLLASTIFFACRGRKDFAIISAGALAVWLFTFFAGIILLIVAIIFLIKGNMMVGWSVIGGIVIGGLLMAIYLILSSGLANETFSIIGI